MFRNKNAGRAQKIMFNLNFERKVGFFRVSHIKVLFDHSKCNCFQEKKLKFVLDAVFLAEFYNLAAMEIKIMQVRQKLLNLIFFRIKLYFSKKRLQLNSKQKLKFFEILHNKLITLPCNKS